MKHALKTTRAENFADWYQEVIQAAEMAEHSGSPGCMIIKPWGFGIWERIQGLLDGLIKATGHSNCSFPLLIPLDLIQKEASHVEGFAKEMAVVTHHRLVARDGKLVPDGELEMPLVVRPTSETIISEAMSRWVNSYRDLPLLLNQWCNVYRWELRPRMFLRTREFFWQEGHTAHATEEEAIAETRTMLGCYRTVLEQYMAIPVIAGEKSPDERFPGAVETHTLEPMMQDGRALQGSTSHYLGQNFAKSADIKFQDKDGTVKFAYTTSWGLSTRVIGALIMTHSDDDGLRLPPQIAPYQVVIVPILRDEETKAVVLERAAEIAKALGKAMYGDEKIRCHVDLRDDTPSNKRWAWIKKGVPIVCELGPRDVANGTIAFLRRDRIQNKSAFVDCTDLAVFAGAVSTHLGEFHDVLYREALAYSENKTARTLISFDEMKTFFAREENGFVIAKWSGDASIPGRLSEMGVTVRCLPYEQSGTAGKCIVTGQDATTDALFARAY